MEEKNAGEKVFEFENIQLNDMFSLSYNFDILKYIIDNLIKNQQKLNCRLIDLKIDKVYDEMKVDELESIIIDLQQSQDNKKLLKKKNKTKNFKAIIDKLTREKDNCFRALKNSNLGRVILNEKAENTLEEKTIEYNEYNDKFNEKLKEEIKEEINEIINVLQEEIENKIRNKSEIIETKIEKVEKIISLINNEVKMIEEKFNTKFTEDLPKIFESLYKEKIAKVNSRIDNFDNTMKKNIKQLEKHMDEISENHRLDNLKFEDNIKENQKLFKEIFKQSSKFEKSFNDCVQLNVFNSFTNEIENKIKKDNRDLNNNILTLEQNVEKIETEISDMKNDKTNKNNFLLLNRRCDDLNTDITKLKEKFLDFDSDRKKLEDLNPNKLIFKSDFDDFNESNNKVIENLKKYIMDMKNMMDDFKIATFKGKASLKDLKNLEDKIISKIFEFNEQINEKFAEKKYVLRNNRFLKIEIKQQLENYKNLDQRTEGGGWLLSKKPIGGHLCASCESYIGDLKENEKYIPWNQIPIKDSNDKFGNINHVFGKMLQKLGNDYKLRRNKSTLDANSTKMNQENSLDEIEAKQCSTNITNKRKKLTIKDNIFVKNLKKKIKIKEIPKLKITNKNELMNNKTQYQLNSKTERDENIGLPETVLGYKNNVKDKDNNFQPKLMKVFKKLI